MPIYKIADIVCKLKSNFKEFESKAKDYQYFGDEPPLIKFTIREDYVRQKYDDKMLMSIGGLENIFMSDIFNKKILKFNAIFLHSSAILYKGKAYLFSADSGVGKSTHTKLWIKKFGAENVQIINDDKPIIRFIGNDWYVYGSPFDGGSGVNTNTRAKLGGIVFLERAHTNSIVKLNKKDVFPMLYKNTIKLSLDDEYADYMLTTADKLISENNFYLLKCNTDIESAEICEKFLTDGR